MPRNPHTAASTLRNRNRITNKTRLKIHQGSLEVDAVLIPDEDEEKHRLTNLVAGVDAEDANEHHLQEVLSAAHRNNINNRFSRGDKPAAPAPSAFIPTPDSTGIVENAAELYPPNKWKDPATYVCTSSTVEENITDGIANGFTYYMDERDQEWLEKNNEEARGEGTSAQGALSVSGTRTSARSAKAKGKEPEALQPVVISDDEFELVMGIFEKVTHERTEYLHHGLETGMDFPAFSEYQDVFSAALPAPMFATYSVPSWIPAPAALLKIAKTIYPYWKERRLERAGHRIIPTLNGDESDTLNESYICFRRRESKAVRKTRASQVTSSDKLARLQLEFTYPLELAKSLLSREKLKKEAVAHSQSIWDKRVALVDLKRKFPSLNDKLDEELLVDKEKPAKRPEAQRVPGLKIRTGDPVVVPRNDFVRPKEAAQKIRELIENHLLKQKDIDHHWDDLVDNPYQTPPSAYASRLFKYDPPPTISSRLSPSSSITEKTDDESTSQRPARAVRMRIGRGGRMLLDRRDVVPRQPIRKLPRSSLFGLVEEDEDSMDVDKVDDSEEAEKLKRLQERWKYDTDDVPSIGPEGPDEQNRVLVDDFHPDYLRHSMTLFGEIDHVALMTDPTLTVMNTNQQIGYVMPYRLGMPQSTLPPRPQLQSSRYPPGIPPQQFPQGLPPGPPLTNGTPVSMPHQIKKIHPPTTAPQMRISSNGGMRPPSIPVLQTSVGVASNGLQVSGAQTGALQNNAIQVNGATPHHLSPPHPMPVPVPQHSPPNGINGTSRAAISMPHVEVQKPEALPTPAINGVTPVPQPEVQAQAEMTVNGLPRPKSQNVTPQSHLALGVPTNGYHLTPMTNLTAAALMNSTAFPHNQNQTHGGLSQQQVQKLQTIFTANDVNALQGRYTNMGMQLPAGSNINLKLPANRQMQWMSAPMQRPSSVVNGINGMDGQVNGVLGQSPNVAQSMPVRSPSANGSRPGMRNGVHVNGQHSMSPHPQHSPSPLPNISQSQSPPRVPMTPNMGMASPSLPQQQPVAGTQNGY